MYMKPKAAHFIVKHDGQEIDTEEALALKWAVATGCGNVDLLRPTQDQLEAIARACNKLNNGMLSRIGFTIELRSA